MTDRMPEDRIDSWPPREPNTIELLENRIKALEDFIKQNHVTYFSYTDDEYGRLAQKLHSETGGLRYAYDGDAGFDLPAIVPDGVLTIWPNEREMLHTGIIIEMPFGYYSRITHRSSTEKRYRLRIVEGTIDNAYRGELLVQVHNPNSAQLQVKHGHKYAQLIVCKTASFPLEYKEKLTPTVRGGNGFGSSGV